MNFFLHINRNFIFFIGLIIIFIFFVIIIVKQTSFKNIEIEISNTNLPDVDITEPKFAINNDSKKIYITAKEGNVKFKSNEFSIETEKVIFNRNNQTARSESKSFFKSENTSISSDGFNIYDKGNKIVFYGNSFIILK